MIFIPFPLVLAETVLFFLAVRQWGFLNTLGLYLLPCLLGFFIVTTVGRMALLTMQSTVMRGQLPTARIMHSGAIFLSGLFFLIPSFFARVLALVLFLPGLRHLAVWRFKIFLAKQVAKGAASFKFSGPFGFGGVHMGGADVQDVRKSEREVYEDNVLDVTPLKITHEKKEEDEGGDSKPRS